MRTDANSSVKGLNMSQEENKEQKEAYLDAVSLSGIERDTLRYLHKVNDNVLDKWLYVHDRYPSFKACYELWMFIRKIKRPMSRKLHRLIWRSQSRASDALETHGHKYSPADGFIIGGKKVAFRYMFNGHYLTIKQLSEIHNVKIELIRRRLKEHNKKPENDVSEIDFSQKRPLYKPRAQKNRSPKLNEPPSS